MATKSIIYIFIFAALVLLALSFWQKQPAQLADCLDFNQGQLFVNGQPLLKVALARTSGEHALGLSNCRQVPRGHGLYFIFNEEKSALFWMKDMLIPIDIIWIKEGRVVKVDKAVPPPQAPDESLPLYYSPEPIDAVLEIAAGEADRLGIILGTTLKISSI